MESFKTPGTCKYHWKGTCKFGSKCALAHVDPEWNSTGPKTSQGESGSPSFSASSMENHAASPLSQRSAMNSVPAAYFPQQVIGTPLLKETHEKMTVSTNPLSSSYTPFSASPANNSIPCRGQSYSFDNILSDAGLARSFDSGVSDQGYIDVNRDTWKEHPLEHNLDQNASDPNRSFSPYPTSLSRKIPLLKEGRWGSSGLSSSLPDRTGYLGMERSLSDRKEYIKSRLEEGHADQAPKSTWSAKSSFLAQLGQSYPHENKYMQQSPGSEGSMSYFHPPGLSSSYSGAPMYSQSPQSYQIAMQQAHSQYAHHGLPVKDRSHKTINSLSALARMSSTLYDTEEMYSSSFEDQFSSGTAPERFSTSLRTMEEYNRYPYPPMNEAGYSSSMSSRPLPFDNSVLPLSTFRPKWSNDILSSTTTSQREHHGYSPDIISSEESFKAAKDTLPNSLNELLSMPEGKKLASPLMDHRSGMKMVVPPKSSSNASANVPLIEEDTIFSMESIEMALNPTQHSPGISPLALAATPTRSDSNKSSPPLSVFGNRSPPMSWIVSNISTSET
jgi:hypothetical protein